MIVWESELGWVGLGPTPISVCLNRYLDPLSFCTYPRLIKQFNNKYRKRKDNKGLAPKITKYNALKKFDIFGPISSTSSSSGPTHQFYGLTWGRSWDFTALSKCEEKRVQEDIGVDFMCKHKKNIRN